MPKSLDKKLDEVLAEVPKNPSMPLEQYLRRYRSDFRFERKLDPYTESLRETIRNLRVTQHCIGCEGLDIEILEPRHHRTWEITHSCDLNCIFCYSKLMPPEKYKCGLRGTLESGVIEISQFGEPTLDFEALIRVIEQLKKDNSYRIDLHTNGTLLDADKISQLIGAGVDIILVSLNAATSETYKKITDTDDLDAVLENLKLIGKSSLHVIMRIVYLPGINEHEILDLFRLARKNNIPEVMLQSCIVYRNTYHALKSAGLDMDRNGLVSELLELVAKGSAEHIEHMNITLMGCLVAELKAIVSEYFPTLKKVCGGPTHEFPTGRYCEILQK